MFFPPSVNGVHEMQVVPPEPGFGGCLACSCNGNNIVIITSHCAGLPFGTVQKRMGHKDDARMMGSSLVSCQSLLFYNAIHPGVMKSEMIPNLLHAVTTAGVCIKDRLVSSMCLGDLG